MRYIDDLADAGDELLGSLELADVGASLFRRRRRGGGGRRINPRKLIPRVTGVPGTIVGLQPLPLGQVIFTPTSGTLLQLVARPQRPFKGQRLVAVQAATAGAAALIVNVLRLEIGTNNQFVFGGAGVPVQAFQAGAFDTNMMLQPATPGVDITLQLQISAAPGAGESVTVSAAMWGTVIA